MSEPGLVLRGGRHQGLRVIAMHVPVRPWRTEGIMSDRYTEIDD